MFNRMNSPRGSPRMDKDIHEVKFPTSYNQDNAEAMKECLAKKDSVAAFRMLQRVHKELHLIKLENFVLNDFLQKNDPKLLNDLDNFKKRNAKIRLSMMEKRKSLVDSSYLGGRQSRATSLAGSAIGSLQKPAQEYNLNYRTKIDMAERLIVEIKKQIEVIKAKGVDDIKILKSKIEAMRYQCADRQEIIRNFEMHFLLNDALIYATEKQKIKQFRKYMNKCLKNGKTMLGTMRLKVTSVKEHCHQLRTILISKAEISGMLVPVDFEQLQIKKEEQIRILEEKNINLFGLKEVAGKTAQCLAKEKKNLETLEEKSKILVEKTAKAIKGISKLEKESRVFENELELEEEGLRHFKIQAEEFEAPSILDYINKKQELVALQKEQKRLQRKANIKTMKLKNIISKLRAENKYK
ncbi:coiled-coil domain-containing protein 113 [Eupeodes corollae]|uniref:coiled-coil domain-containing protein 113 n=1 Tax=Eupeodes corollae TaxID=290404 RepID=UPI002493C132|nr:coiled-coil domain-containing protein 113 [Eupeodes corollae]